MSPRVVRPVRPAPIVVTDLLDEVDTILADPRAVADGWAPEPELVDVVDDPEAFTAGLRALLTTLAGGGR